MMISQIVATESLIKYCNPVSQQVLEKSKGINIVKNHFNQLVKAKSGRKHL